MSTKGESKRSKAISMPKQINMGRKGNYWTIRAKSGPHNKETAMALGLIIRDFAKVATTLKEAKEILNNGEVKVNGIVRNEHQFPVGLFDIVSIEKQKLFFRIMLDDKERLLVKLLDKNSMEKISKVSSKIMTSDGIQITTNDGRVYTGIKANVGDSLKIKLPEGKVEEVLEFKDGSTAYLTKGAHCSELATVKGIIEGTARRAKLVKLSNGKEDFETIAENVFIIGKNKAALAEMH